MVANGFLTDTQIEDRALTHRRELGFRDEQAIDFMTLITKLKQRYPNFNYKRVEDGSLGEAEAQWDSDRKLVLIPETTFQRANAGSPRDLFTIVHEIGHALLGHKGVLNRAPMGNKVERISIRVRSMEYQARRYAAAFLVPNVDTNHSLSAEQMARQFTVSLALAKQRIEELARLQR